MTLCVLSHKPEDDGTVKPRQAGNGLQICLGHLDQLRRLLIGGEHMTRTGELVHTQGLAELDEELAVSHDPRGTVGEKTKRQKSPFETPIPARLTVTILRKEIYEKTNSWARVVCEDRELATWQLSPVLAAAAFLEAHSEWLAGQDCAKALYDELSDLPRRAHNAIDPSHQPRTLFLPAAPCLEHECPGTLTALVRGNEATPQDVDLCCSADETHVQTVRRYLAFAERKEAS